MGFCGIKVFERWNCASGVGPSALVSSKDARYSILEGVYFGVVLVMLLQFDDLPRGKRFGLSLLRGLWRALGSYKLTFGAIRRTFCGQKNQSSMSEHLSTDWLSDLGRCYVYRSIFTRR